jgi:hypothetical protein
MYLVGRQPLYPSASPTDDCKGNLFVHDRTHPFAAPSRIDRNLTDIPGDPLSNPTSTSHERADSGQAQDPLSIPASTLNESSASSQPAGIHTHASPTDTPADGPSHSPQQGQSIPPIACVKCRDLLPKVRQLGGHLTALYAFTQAALRRAAESAERSHWVLCALYELWDFYEKDELDDLGINVHDGANSEAPPSSASDAGNRSQNHSSTDTSSSDSGDFLDDDDTDNIDPESSSDDDWEQPFDENIGNLWR